MSKEELFTLVEKISNDPFGKYNGNEALYVLKALDTGDPKNKEVPWTRRLEEAFSQKLGVKYSIAHNSGTSTLHSCLAAAGVGAGDEVIVPAQTVIMCGSAALFQNAIPVYADSEKDTFNIDPIDIERKITNKTKAIIAVHMHGLPANMPAIMEIAKKRNIFVVEDCAQCIMGTINGVQVGSFGDMSSFSFESKKHLSTGEGGIVTTNDEDLATKIRKFGGLGYKTLSASSGLRNILPRDFQDPHYKRHDTVGYNYRMPEVIAAMGLAQLERLSLFIERRKAVAKLYDDLFNTCSWITPQRVPKNFTSSYWSYALFYEGDKAHDVSWRQFYDLVGKNGGDYFYGDSSLAYEEIAMQTAEFYGNRIPKSKELYPQEFQYKRGICPVAEEVQPRIMRLKTNYRNMDIAKLKVDAIAKTIKEIEGQ